MARLLLRTLICTFAVAGIQAFAQNSGKADDLLPAPVLTSPANGAQVPHQGHDTVRFEWERVQGAATYGIEIDCFGCCDDHHWCSDKHHLTQVEWLVASPYFFRHLLGRPGAWRVWAVDEDGNPGKVSGLVSVYIRRRQRLPISSAEGTFQPTQTSATHCTADQASGGFNHR